jgi:hypothetical protein
MVIEICRICKLVKSSDLFPRIYKKHAGGTIPPGVCDMIDVDLSE